MRINVPNQITIGRLFLAIIFFAIISFYEQRAPTPATWMLDVCVVLFAIAAISDIVDGYLARKHGQVTSLGRILDPFVDKILVCGAYAFFAGDGFTDAAGQNVTRVDTWMAVLILGRELLVTGIRGFSESKGDAFGANAVGKAKMVTQSATAMVVMFSVAHPTLLFSTDVHLMIRLVLVWLTVIVTAISMVVYLGRARALLEDASRA